MLVTGAVDTVFLLVRTRDYRGAHGERPETKHSISDQEGEAPRWRVRPRSGDCKGDLWKLLFRIIRDDAINSCNPPRGLVKSYGRAPFGSSTRTHSEVAIN